VAYAASVACVTEYCVKSIVRYRLASEVSCRHSCGELASSMMSLPGPFCSACQRKKTALCS